MCDTPARHHMLLNKTPVSRINYILLSHQSHPETFLSVVNALDYLLQHDNKALLLKATHTNVIEYGEI